MTQEICMCVKCHALMEPYEGGYFCEECGITDPPTEF